MVNHIQGAEDPTSAAGPTSMLVMEQPDDMTTHQTSEPQHVLHGSQQSLFSEYPNELEIGTDSSDVSRSFHFEIKQATLISYYLVAGQSR